MLSDNIFIARRLNLEFNLDFKSATSFGCPDSFDPVTDFIRPTPKKTVRIQCDNLPSDPPTTNLQDDYLPTVTDLIIDGTLRRHVDPPKISCDFPVPK
jgi:hypothetical protein